MVVTGFLVTFLMAFSKTDFKTVAVEVFRGFDGNSLEENLLKWGGVKIV